jgi:hypothetical protein
MLKNDARSQKGGLPGIDGDYRPPAEGFKLFSDWRLREELLRRAIAPPDAD